MSPTQPMPATFEFPMPPADPQGMGEVEQRLGVKLPDAHKALLARSNGGHLEGNALSPGTDYSLRHLFSAGPVADPDVDDLESQARFYHHQADFPLPETLLPIGEDEGGNVVCLQTTDDDRGATYFWEHDAVADDDGLTKIADSFSDFLDRLRPY